jgi:cardiolipin hydrolase
MAHADLTNHLKQTISDHRVSRSERRALQALAAEIDLDQHQLSLLKSRVFEIARNELISPDAKEVNEWVESVLKAIRPPTDRPTIESEALFSPDDACALKIVSLIQRARSSIDVCVFTITDNRIADALCDATRRRIAIRVISDDDKSFDRGSDLQRISDSGIEVRTDNAPSHMHHKYAIFDRKWLLTGSYNWTRSASNENEENIVVTNDPNLSEEFQRHFDRLWKKYG